MHFLKAARIRVKLSTNAVKPTTLSINWHLKSQQENKDFGPFQNTRVSEQFKG